MKRKMMQQLAGQAPTHDCAPKDWRKVPKMTGDYDLDATIMHRNNSDLPHRLSLYLRSSAGPGYGPLSGYNGYHGYHGDN